MSDAVVPAVGGVVAVASTDSSYKSPPVILGAINSAMIVGASAYFYKRLETMELTIKTIQDNQKMLVEKLKEIKDNNVTNTNSITILNKAIDEMGEQIDTNVFNLDNDLNGLIEALDEFGVNYEREMVSSPAGNGGSGGHRRPQQVNHRQVKNVPKSRQKHQQEEDSFLDEKEVNVEDVAERVRRNRGQQRN